EEEREIDIARWPLGEGRRIDLREVDELGHRLDERVGAQFRYGFLAGLRGHRGDGAAQSEECDTGKGGVHRQSFRRDAAGRSCTCVASSKRPRGGLATSRWHLSVIVPDCASGCKRRVPVSAAISVMLRDSFVDDLFTATTPRGGS